VMSDGRALQIDKPRAIYDHPANRFVADFIGESSFLRGTRAGDAGEFVRFALTDGQAILAREGTDLGGGEAVAMVRPEHTTLFPQGSAAPEGAWNQVDATVGELEYLGSDVHYFLHLPNGDRVQSRMPAAAESFEPGQRVQIRIPAARTVLVQADQATPTTSDTGGITPDEN
jgi:spermidine/putrescine transport system ATP-binding protein